MINYMILYVKKKNALYNYFSYTFVDQKASSAPLLILARISAINLKKKSTLMIEVNNNMHCLFLNVVNNLN